MSRLKQLGKDSVVYGLGGILAKSVSLFTLPIYTRIFTPADYGTIEMLGVLTSFARPLWSRSWNRANPSSVNSYLGSERYVRSVQN